MCTWYEGFLYPSMMISSYTQQHAKLSVFMRIYICLLFRSNVQLGLGH